MLRTGESEDVRGWMEGGEAVRITIDMIRAVIGRCG